MSSETSSTAKSAGNDIQNRGVTSFIVGATAGIAGLLATIIAGVVYMAVSKSSGYGDEIVVLTSQNRVWLITGSIVFLGLIAFICGGAVVLHRLRPQIQVGTLASTGLAVGGVALLLSGLLMMHAMNTYAVGSPANFSIPALGLLMPASNLASYGVLSGVLCFVVGGVWLLVRAVRAGARRVAAAP